MQRLSCRCGGGIVGSWWCFALLTWFGVFAPTNSNGQAVASGGQVAALFPAAGQVVRDYPTEPEQVVALNLLWDVLNEKAPQDPAAMLKRKSYRDAAEAIRQRQQASGSAAYERFFKRQSELAFDAVFRRDVRAKYALDQISAAAPPVPSSRPRTIDDISEQHIFKAFVVAPACMLAGLIAMIWVARGVVFRASRGKPMRPQPSIPAVPGLPPLPPGLREIEVPGLIYPVEILSGRVFDKETKTETHVTTMPLSGGALPMDDATHARPVRDYVHVVTKTQVLAWVRTPEGAESAWTFKGDGFSLRAQQAVSTLVVAGAKGAREIALAYNHATRQLVTFESALAQAHAARVGLAWPAATLVGSLGIAAGLSIIRIADPYDVAHQDNAAMAARLFDAWQTAALVSVVLGLFIAYYSRMRLMRRRNVAFHARYPQRFAAYFEQCTPALERHFRS